MEIYYPLYSHSFVFPMNHPYLNFHQVGNAYSFNHFPFLFRLFTPPTFCALPRSGLELGKNAATRVPDPRGKDSSSKPSADAAKRINQMRDRSRAHVMAGKAVGAHNAGGSNWAGGNDKVL